jgi:hypothetical protein
LGRIILRSGDVVGVEFRQKVCKTDDLHTDGGGKEELLDDNVVLFPRDWLGPRDELIPIGRPPERSANGQADDGAPAPTDPAPTADDFWSEGSAALQSALRAPEDFAAIEARAGGWSGRRIRALTVGAFCAIVLVCVAVFATGGERGRPQPAGTALASTDTLRAEAGLRGHDARASVAQSRPVARAAHPKRRALTHRHVRTVIVEQVHYVMAPPSTASPSAPSTASPSVPSQSTTATSTRSASSNAQKQPATGADGVLGPGTSPDG